VQRTMVVQKDYQEFKYNQSLKGVELGMGELGLENPQKMGEKKRVEGRRNGVLFVR